MKKLLPLLIMLFVVKCKIPFGADVTYHHVKAFSLGAAGSTWELTLEDGRKAFVPVMFSVIEEEDADK